MAASSAEVGLPLDQLPYTNGHSHDGLLSNGDHVNGTSSISIPVEERIKRKARRPSKLLALETGQDDVVDSATGASVANGHRSPTANLAQRAVKNSRRSRNGFGRGLPKKGGAGGKGTWGKPGSELIVEEEDIRDPNYDSDSHECELETFVPELSEDQMEKYIDPILQEYFEHGDTGEVILSLEELNLGALHPHLVLMAITLAMERKPSHREMTSVMLSDLFGRILSEEDIAKGFDILLRSLPDLVLDTPEAPTILGNFIARAVADDCLPPKFLQGYRGTVDCQHARACLEHADTLLSMKHGLVRLDNVWGVGGGMRPVKYLIRKIQLLLEEYLSSGDIAEAIRCLQELEVPHFHHELVYEAFVIVIENMGERAMDLMCKLLKSMTFSVIITPDQMIRGVERVFHEMPEICIDVPPAYAVLESFATKCHAAGFLNEDLLKSIPTRGRKRFVSEGDGGRIKEEEY